MFRHEQDGKVYAPNVCGLPNIVTAEICTVLLAGVLGQVGVAVFHVKNMVIHKFPHHGLKVAHPHDHTRPPRLSFALAMVLTINSQRFQRTHPFRGMGDSSLNAPKDVAMGLTCLAPIVNQIQWLAQDSAVDGSACSCVLETGSAREDRSSDVCNVGDTRKSFSEKR